MSVSHAHDGFACLLDRLGRLVDPRRPRGVRHPLVAVLGVLVIVTLAGAVNYRQMGSVAADLPQCLLNRLGVRWNLRRRRRVAPSSGTLRRMLIALDADMLDALVGEWLREHGDCDQTGWRIAVDGKDLRGGWSDEGRLVLFSAMTKEIPLAVTSRATLTAASFCEGVRGHWSVGNLSHRHRDTTWREDDHHAYVGNGP